jgi:DNA-binding response OmpR family regulator
MPSTVLVADDERHIVQLVKLYLSNEGFRVETAADGQEALEKARRLRPDLIVLDLMMPRVDGWEVCRRLRKESNVPVIMLTARTDDVDKIVGLELGADDYIVKPFSAREVVARIRAVLRRAGDQAGAHADGPIEIGPLRLDRARRGAALDGEELDLTRKEFELLELLMSEAGSVITRERLIDEVWDVNWFGSTKTLDVHVSGLRRKLGDSSRSPRFIHTVRGVGFRFAGLEELG